jgi:hypothetical protein
MLETLEQTGTRNAPRRRRRAPSATRRAGQARTAPVTSLQPWVRTQALNVTRHAAALRPFSHKEFGGGAEAPSEGHIQATNQLISSLRERMLRVTSQVTQAASGVRQEPTAARLQQMLGHKEHAHDWVRRIERIWDFYFELFGQRQSRFGPWLLACDRIARNCYQVAFLGINTHKSVPQPPPFSYMRTGFSPATFRRRIPLRALGLQLNPFPLIQLPYHRLINPWALGAILHEVSHNTQNDLQLDKVVPSQIVRRLLSAGMPRQVAAVWRRWNREIFADLSGLLLGGPAIVPSLMDVIGRSARTVVTYSGRGPHPTPYLRAFISIDLLRRMGFADEAASYRRMWTRMYPNSRSGNIPAPILDTFEEAHRIVVDTICFQPYKELGNRSLAQVIDFKPTQQLMIEEAARRLAVGTDPGIIPARFLIGAARVALERAYARPGVIMENFYKELAGR